MYCKVSNVFCIIHGNFKISIIYEKLKNNERTVWESIWKNNDATARKYQNKLNMSVKEDIGGKHASIF